MVYALGLKPATQGAYSQHKRAFVAFYTKLSLGADKGYRLSNDGVVVLLYSDRTDAKEAAREAKYFKYAIKVMLFDEKRKKQLDWDPHRKPIKVREDTGPKSKLLTKIRMRDRMHDFIKESSAHTAGQKL